MVRCHANVLGFAVVLRLELNKIIRYYDVGRNFQTPKTLYTILFNSNLAMVLSFLVLVLNLKWS